MMSLLSALCLDPTDPPNGMVTVNGNSVGDTATYTCNSGFELDGPQDVTCEQTDDMASFSSPPTCRGM